MMRWAGHVAGMESMRDAYKISYRKPEGRHHSEYIVIDGRII